MIRKLVLVAACLLLLPTIPMTGAEDPLMKVMELKAPAPAWFTPEVAAAAEKASAEGKLLDPFTGETFTPAQAARLSTTSTPVPVGAPDYLFIRPGALLLTSGVTGSFCTYNFIYGAGTQIGTAGHCVSAVGQRLFILSSSTINSGLPLLAALGSVNSFHNNGIGDDWALIDIDSQWLSSVDPNMAWLGGPSCAAWTGGVGVVKHTGHGIQTGLVASVPRMSANLASNGRSFEGVGELSGGDSGSPAVQVSTSANCAMGSAAGILTHCATVTGTECLPVFFGTDIRRVPATVTTGFDPL